MAPKAKPKAKAPVKAAAPAKAAVPVKAAAKANIVPGSPSAGSGAAAVKQNRVDNEAAAAKSIENASAAKPNAEVDEGNASAKESSSKIDSEAKDAAGQKESAAAETTAEMEAKAQPEADVKAEEEAKQKAEAEAEKAKQKANAEAEIARLKALANGEVTIKYSMYAEKFTIIEHKLKATDIDELYCLSDVMPGCFIHLSEKEFKHDEEHKYVKEEPAGTFLGLMAGETYWCYVQQDAEQEKRDQENMRKVWAGVTQAKATEGEHCSCKDGAPCTDSSICNDWPNRFANALKAGGNPILFVQ